MTALQYPVLDIETVAIRIETVVSTLQMVIEEIPSDGKAGQVPDVLCLCRDFLSDQKRELEQIAEGLKPLLKVTKE